MTSDSIRNVLITGGTGLLGFALQKNAPQNISGFTIYYPERNLSAKLPFSVRAADVANRTQMQAVFEWSNPDVVIHTAAIGSVDFAEKNREQTRKINVGGTEIVAEMCQRFQSHLIYISSNAVFDGCNPFYAETDPVNPINYYGQLKVEAENIVRRSNIPWAIVRPIMMYGWPYPGERDNPVVWWIRSLKNGALLRVVDNVFNKPLAVWFCAEVIWSIIRQNKTGSFHVAGRDHVSLYEFALLTAEVFGFDKSLIMPVPDSFFPEIAPRPRDTSFNTAKIEKELKVVPVGIKEGLIQMKNSFPADFVL